jgi:hypothetical protein
VSRKHRHDKHKEYPVAKPVAGTGTADYEPAYPPQGLLTFSTKVGLVLIVLLSIGLGSLILLAPPPKGHKVKLPWNDDGAVAKVDSKEKDESTEKKPAEKAEKPAEKKSDEKKPADKEKKPAEKTTEKKPADKEKEKEKKPAEKMTEKKPMDKDKAMEKKPAEKEKEKEKTVPEKKPPEKTTEKPKEEPAVAGVLFEKHVMPIFEAKCINCHGATQKKAGLDVRSLKTLLKGGDGGPAVVKGDIKKSILWEKLESDEMPKDDTKLSPEEKEVIKKWIIGGAKTSAMASSK